MRLLPSAVAALMFLIALGASPSAGQAEEITLENGQKVTGEIVGFENGMFKVETEYGFALVRKDKVKSISFAPGDASHPPVKTTNPPQESQKAPGHRTPAPQPIMSSPPPASEASLRFPHRFLSYTLYK